MLENVSWTFSEENSLTLITQKTHPSPAPPSPYLSYPDMHRHKHKHKHSRPPLCTSAALFSFLRSAPLFGQTAAESHKKN